MEDYDQVPSMAPGKIIRMAPGGSAPPLIPVMKVFYVGENIISKDIKGVGGEGVIDIRGRVPFQAVCEGVVRKVEKKFNDGNGFWQVNLVIKYNTDFKVQYVFEPFSSLESDGDFQMDNILVSKGDEVNQGQLIGYLLYRRPGAHVDFSLNRNGDEICPESFFTAAACQAIYAILHDTIPNAKMCYE